MIDFFISPWTTPHLQMTLLQSLTASVEILAVLIVGYAVFMYASRKW